MQKVRKMLSSGARGGVRPGNCRWRGSERSGVCSGCEAEDGEADVASLDEVGFNAKEDAFV